MHELSLCQALIATAQRQLTIRPEYTGRRLKTLKVSVGALSGCEPDLLVRMFPHAATGTFAENASLQVDFQPAQVACDACGARRDVAANDLVCPNCGGSNVTLVAGDGVFLTSLTLTND
jgi:hydrogenase nickel incorporation protein HypA/HybF